MKFAKSDATKIISRFLGNDSLRRGQSESFIVSHPDPDNTLLSFRLGASTYHVLVDSVDIEDEPALRHKITVSHQDNIVTPLPNPDDPAVYGMPYKGKSVYAFKETRPVLRLDHLLQEMHPTISRSALQKYIQNGHVTVDGSIETKPSLKIPATSQVVLTMPTHDHSHDTLPILYIDDNIIVIDKPVGILTHAKGGIHDEFTVASFFARYMTDGTETNRPGIVHRLDRATSGIMVGARNQETLTFLQKQFANRTVKKTYVAVVSPAPEAPEAVIDVPIARNPKRPSTFMVSPTGKSAQTYYSTQSTRGTYALLTLAPKTGRTHQLRVHLSYIGSPIVGDTIYGSQDAPRLMLHAHSLEITLPGGKREVFTSDVPDSFDWKNISYD